MDRGHLVTLSILVDTEEGSTSVEQCVSIGLHDEA